MKRMIAALLALSLLPVLSGCGGHGRELRLYVGAPEGSGWQQAVETFQEEVEASTKRKVRVEWDAPAGDSIPGGGDLVLRALSDWQGIAPELSVASMPWLFSGYAEVERVLLEGPGKEALFQRVRDHGAEPLALGGNGFRQIANDRRPVLSPADLQGMRVRVPDGSVSYDILRCLGAEGVPLDRDQVLDALLDESVDGEEVPVGELRDAGTYRVQRYLTLWDCSYDPVCLAVSQEVWDALDPDTQTALRSAAEHACAAQTSASLTGQEAALSEIRASGVAVTSLDEAQTAAFRAAAAPLYREWRDRIGDDLFAVFGYTFD